MRYVIYLLIAGNVFALAIGALMVLAPEKVGRWIGPGAQRISLRKLTRPLDVTHDTDGAMLRRPRLLGAILVASALVILARGAMFASQVSVTEGGRMLGQFFSGARWPSGAWESLWLACIIAILLGSVLALFVGLMALFRANLLRAWSEVANRWVSTRRATKPLARSYAGLDRLIREQPRVWGGVIVLLALYAAGMLVWFAKLA